MKQKKWFFVAGILLIASLMIAGVQLFRSTIATRTLAVQPESERSKEVITFSFTSFGSDAEMKKLIDRYNQSNPDQSFVQMLTIPRENYTRTLNMLMTSGEGPDLFAVQSDWITTYMYKNWFKDLTDYISKAVEVDYSNWALDYGSFNGRKYAIPYGLSTVRLGYNKELFRLAGLDENRPPKTLADLKSMATIISQKQVGNQKYGFVWPLAEDWYGFMQSMEIPLTYSGVSVFNFKAGRFDASGYEPWMETMLEMNKNGSMFPGNLTMKYDTALTQFAKGNVGMMLLSSSDVYRLENELNLNVDWGVTMPPAMDEQKASSGALMLVPEPVIGINSATKHSTAAIHFWQYLHSERVIKELYQKGALIPVSSRIRQDYPSELVLTKSKFRNFQPTDAESFYPKKPILLDSTITPTVFNQDHFGWNNRLKAYREIASGTASVHDTLQSETQRLNLMLQGAIQMGSISIQGYMQESFDMKHPLQE
ncbi:ABC transporter substrate-binding protein [Paenibacillus roseipurpureus]|uniref:Extracellular solute-binding protein n=1 Tax=Paenibacillus roseopurpureus TaxID=2918901 RepID=A0AA96LRZ9_9BACL|nr:extracellular solute-binding protein [Paenibacillus sp. MBLB1832]WNR46156.1 extracellular solute-binding protein [Paenibacillus sp. MBLB1832]